MSGKYDLRHFRRCDHDYAQMLRKICDVAEIAVGQLPAGVERNAGLRRLLEASDCFKRAIGELNHRDTRQVETDNRYGVDPVSGHPLPKDSPYAASSQIFWHDPDCAINTPPYFPEQCNCDAISGQPLPKDSPYAVREAVSLPVVEHNEYDPECRCSRCEFPDRTGS